MRRGRIVRGVTALVAAALVAAPSAFAAGADHGKASAQGYPKFPKIVSPSVTPVTPPGRLPSKTTGSGVAGVQHTINLRSSHVSHTLPFTGAQLWLFALVGLGLVAGGVALKSTARARSRA